MVNRGQTLRLNALATLREFAGHGLQLMSRPNFKISGLGIKLRSMRFADPVLAQEMSKGKFSFAGSTVTVLPAKLFEIAPPTPKWAASLHSLNWLNHFVASGQELHRIVARQLVEKWGMPSNGRYSCNDQSNALMSLSFAAHFLLDSSTAFREPFFAIVERQIRRVSSLRPKDPSDRLLQVISLQCASLAFRTPHTLRDDANTRFCEAISQVILPDGGHISRNPQQLLETLLNIMPIRDAMLAHHQAVPQPLSAAIERMLPMLRMLSHGDHGLASFQGSGDTRTGVIKTIFETDKVSGRPLLLAPHSGYCRLSHRAGLLIADVGTPARCNGTLAFEFSEGWHRIFNNCGMPVTTSQAWQDAAAGLAAHNTLEVDGFSTGTLNQTRAEVINSPRGSLLKCQNHMVGKAGDVIHERCLFLSQTGRDLRGEDTLTTVEHGFTIRFHLHPTVKATSIRKGSKVVLVLPNRAAWTFSAAGGAISLEESIFLADESGPRKTMQIVIRSSPENASPVKWALRRVEKSAAAGNEQEEAPQLPF